MPEGEVAFATQEIGAEDAAVIGEMGQELASFQEVRGFRVAGCRVSKFASLNSRVRIILRHAYAPAAGLPKALSNKVHEGQSSEQMKSPAYFKW